MTDYTITDRPVTGEINRNLRRASAQITPAEFLARIDAVFAFPQVEKIRWTQYTPFFNDGEECIFSVHEAEVRITGVDEEAGENGDGYLSTWDINPKYRGRSWDDGTVPENAWEVYPALDALSSDDWEDVARQNFGDHAEVTATREGFSVEYYEHE